VRKRVYLSSTLHFLGCGEEFLVSESESWSLSDSEVIETYLMFDVLNFKGGVSLSVSEPISP
jgi:hypothetical protein